MSLAFRGDRRALGLLSSASPRPSRSPGALTDEWTRSYPPSRTAKSRSVGANGAVDVRAAPERPSTFVRNGSPAPQRCRRRSECCRALRFAKTSRSDKIVLRTRGSAGIIIGVEVSVNYKRHDAGHGPGTGASRERRCDGRRHRGAVVLSSTNGGVIGRNLRGGVEARAVNRERDDRSGGIRCATPSTCGPRTVRSISPFRPMRMPSLEANYTNGSPRYQGSRLRADWRADAASRPWPFERRRYADHNHHRQRQHSRTSKTQGSVNEDKASRYHRLKRHTGLISLVWSAILLGGLIVTGGSIGLRNLAQAFSWGAIPHPALAGCRRTSRCCRSLTRWSACH